MKLKHRDGQIKPAGLAIMETSDFSYLGELEFHKARLDKVETVLAYMIDKLDEQYQQELVDMYVASYDWKPA
jgi:hypothetical protein